MSEETFGAEYFVKYLIRDTGLLDSIEKDSVERGVNIVGPSVGSMLSLLVKITGAKRILELGTANGYSTIWMARALGKEGRITTVEWGQDMADEALENFKKDGVEGRIDIKVGDALEIMKNMNEDFDIIFMDIEKEQYTSALSDCVRLLRKGGLLFCDNVAFVSSGDFNQKLSEHPQLETSFVYGVFHNHAPDEDAVSLSVKIRDE